MPIVKTWAKDPGLDAYRPMWAPGVWNTEADFMLWEGAYVINGHTHTVACCARRNTLGSWCGYCGVKPGHPWHEAHHYDDAVLDDVAIHGGLTFSDVLVPGFYETLSVPEIMEAAVAEYTWWVGFDCGHAGDYIPVFGTGFVYSLYKDQQFIRDEVNNLAHQAAKAMAEKLANAVPPPPGETHYL